MNISHKTIKSDTAIVWVRNDFRIKDNPALAYALRHHEAVLCVYFDEIKLKKPSASDWWLHNAMADFSNLINKRLLVLNDNAQNAFDSLFKIHKFSAVYWNRRYEPCLKKNDMTIKNWLKSKNVIVESFPGNYLFEPWEITKSDGTPYRVFTPFYKAALARGFSKPYPNIPKKDFSKIIEIDNQDYFAKQEAKIPDWMEDFRDFWIPTESEVRERVKTFTKKIMANYENGRNFPSDNFCSRLSPWLHHGQIGVKELANICGQFDNSESFLRELVWREFANYVMFHYPETENESMDKRFKKMPWSDNKKALSAWCKGQTGIPLVDAGMRELWHTGFMHNRIRMVVASFLTKHLMIDWRRGAEWFENTLLDADIPSNRMGWQWCAGSGVDAAPYFRIFNPISQGKRFDAQGVYVKKWVPELSSIPEKWIHNPWEAPQDVLDASEVKIGSSYPEPIIDLKYGRERALKAWATIKG